MFFLKSEKTKNTYSRTLPAKALYLDHSNVNIVLGIIITKVVQKWHIKSHSVLNLANMIMMGDGVV